MSHKPLICNAFVLVIVIVLSMLDCENASNFIKIVNCGIYATVWHLCNSVVNMSHSVINFTVCLNAYYIQRYVAFLGWGSGVGLRLICACFGASLFTCFDKPLILLGYLAMCQFLTKSSFYFIVCYQWFMLCDLTSPLNMCAWGDCELCVEFSLTLYIGNMKPWPLASIAMRRWVIALDLRAGKGYYEKKF